MKTRILYVRVTARESPERAQEIRSYLEAFSNPDTEIDVVNLSKGPRSNLEYQYYEAFSGPGILKWARYADENGYDAVLLGCFYDPFLRAAREICEKTIVVGPAEAAMTVAAGLGDKFSVIVGRRKWIPQMRQHAEECGFGPKLASMRPVDLTVQSLHADKEKTIARIRREIGIALEEDQAECIVFGCTMFRGLFQKMQEEFQVPVVDAMVAALKYAEHLVELKRAAGWYFSKKAAYESPPKRELEEWRLEDLF